MCQLAIQTSQYATADDIQNNNFHSSGDVCNEIMVKFFTTLLMFLPWR